MPDRKEKVVLPAAHRAEEIHLAMQRAVWSDLVVGLNAAAPNEACAFVLTRPSIGIVRHTAILGEIVWPREGEVEATPGKLEISADYISRALDVAAEAGPRVGLCLVHSHPDSEWGPGIAEFSRRDDWYEQRLFPTIVGSRPEALSASLVLNPKGEVDARVWWRETKGAATQKAQVLRIVGPELTVLETPASTWSDHADPTVMDRSTRLWGGEGRRRLQNLRVGIVGGGGTGSLVTFATATMGVGKLRIWDKDTGSKQNRNRTAGITKEFIDKPKVEALKALAETVATAEPFLVEIYQDWATTEQGLRQLRDCDIIFCCVDKFAPRVPLNDLAYAHLIPTLDMASWIHPDRDGNIDALMTHAHVWSPGIPCAWCRETLTSYRLTQEAQGEQRGAEKRIPYGLPLEAIDAVEPSVLPLNMLGVSLALMQFMQVALKITTRTPNDLKFILPEWELDESDRKAKSECDCVQTIGLGDTLPIRPVIME